MRFITILFSLAIVVTTQAQLKIIDPLGGPDLSNTVVDLIGSSQDENLERPVWVINNSNSELVIGLRRIEVNITAGTETNLCWLICPADPVLSGDFPTWTSPFTETIAAGDTAFSFAFHYHPNHLSGCGLFDFEFFDNISQDVLGNFSIMVDHGSTTECITGLGDEIVNSSQIIVYPNPADVDLSVFCDSQSEITSLQLHDITGREVTINYSNTSKNSFIVETGLLKNGVYFLAIEFENNKRITRKIQIIH